MEPCYTTVRIAADSEKEATEKLHQELGPQVHDFSINTIVEICEIASNPTPEPQQFEPLPDNIIVFPGTTTKH